MSCVREFVEATVEAVLRGQNSTTILFLANEFIDDEHYYALMGIRFSGVNKPAHYELFDPTYGSSWPVSGEIEPDKDILFDTAYPIREDVALKLDFKEKLDARIEGTLLLIRHKGPSEIDDKRIDIEWYLRDIMITDYFYFSKKFGVMISVDELSLSFPDSYPRGYKVLTLIDKKTGNYFPFIPPVFTLHLPSDDTIKAISSLVEKFSKDDSKVLVIHLEEKEEGIVLPNSSRTS